jgi:polyribonucleotide nucleotidyltransferase
LILSLIFTQNDSLFSASYALHTSDIPWNGPVGIQNLLKKIFFFHNFPHFGGKILFCFLYFSILGCVRVGMKDSKFIINPPRKVLEKSPLNLVVTVNPDGNIVMLEGWADNLKQSKFIDGLEYGIVEASKVIEKIKTSIYATNQIDRKIESPTKKSILLDEQEKVLLEAISSLAEIQLHYVYTNSEYDKISRDDAVNGIRLRTMDLIKNEHIRNDSDFSKCSEIFTEVAKKVFRRVIIEEGKRCDGRRLDQMRPISCNINMLESLHGSALFQRGQTQVLSTLTFDSPDSMYRSDTALNMVSPSLTKVDKKFMLHYEFPQYAVNEIGRGTGRTDRREIGHGALAEKALYPLIPSETNFTIRLLCEVLESNGSSSMASVCAGSLALVDAGKFEVIFELE